MNSTEVTHEKEKTFNSTTVKHEKDKNLNTTAPKHEKDKDLNTTAPKHEKDKDLNSTAVTHQKEKPTDTGVTRNDTTSSKSVPTNTGQHEGSGKRGGTINSQFGSDVSCARSTKNCTILNTMVACVLPSEPGNLLTSLFIILVSLLLFKYNLNYRKVTS